jgi:hypothetical protein
MDRAGVVRARVFCRNAVRGTPLLATAFERRAPPATFDHSHELRGIKAPRPMWRFPPGRNGVSLCANNAAFGRPE